MGNIAIRSVKNIGILILKLIILAILLLHIGYTFFAFLNDTIDIFKRYQDIRGLYNYGITVEANKVNYKVSDFSDIVELYPKESENFDIYRFKIGEKDFFVRINGESLDKSIEIVYDELNPNIVTKKVELHKINHFYEDRLNVLANMYLMLLGYILGYGIIWYLLDLIKYSKKIWKECV